MKFRILSFFLVAYLAFSLSTPALGVPDQEAVVISAAFQGSGFSSLSFLDDGELLKGRTSEETAALTLTASRPIGYLYLIFQEDYPEYTIENQETGEKAAIQGNILHQCIDIADYFDTLPTALTLHFDSGSVSLNEIIPYSSGSLPPEVQQWKPPAEGETDLLLLCTHGDDEQLFFAGLLPLYAGEKNATVQVVYLTDHRNLTNSRVHEMLNGLWAVGCNVYPVFGDFPDFRIDDLNKTYREYDRLGYSRDQLMAFVVTQLRRFRPLTVVGHDLNGEYGHGMHMVYADCLTQALEVSADSGIYPQSAEAYGIWDVPKAYLHLYPENPIVMDYDQPLSSFNGMTAFQVTQKQGFPCHKSQQYTWFTRWLYGRNKQITQASQISSYSPCEFGLYRSTVGPDTVKNDFLENITTYAEQRRLEQERLEAELAQQERLEQQRLEAERAEQERLEQQRLEAERAEQAELERQRLEQEQKAAEEKALHSKLRAAVWTLLILISCLILLLIFRRKRTH